MAAGSRSGLDICAILRGGVWLGVQARNQSVFLSRARISSSAGTRLCKRVSCAKKVFLITVTESGDRVTGFETVGEVLCVLADVEVGVSWCSSLRILTNLERDAICVITSDDADHMAGFPYA